MHQQWEFFGGTDVWSWRYVDSDNGSIIKHAEECFDTLFACIKDAEQQGYRSSAPEKRVYRLAA